MDLHLKIGPGDQPCRLMIFGLHCFRIHLLQILEVWLGAVKSVHIDNFEKIEITYAVPKFALNTNTIADCWGFFLKKVLFLSNIICIH